MKMLFLVHCIFYQFAVVRFPRTKSVRKIDLKLTPLLIIWKGNVIKSISNFKRIFKKSPFAFLICICAYVT